MGKNKGRQSSVARVYGFPGQILTFIKQSKDELKKVTWPNRQTTIRYTIVVVVVSLVIGGVIGGIDYTFQLVLESIIK